LAYKNRLGKKNKDFLSAQKSFVKSIVLLIVFVLSIIFIFGDHGLLELYKLKRKSSQVQNYIEALRTEKKQALKEKNKLENDLEYIEKLAREKYKMVKPGEKIFKVLPK
tara:strand:+ start:315 stop:641 length:327 start_codon:yes stop_codon:yes gene_type:complete